MTDPDTPSIDAPEDFNEHVDYLRDLIDEATSEDAHLRERIYAAVEELVVNIDGGPWSDCRVCWTPEIPDDLAEIDGLEGEV